MCIYDKYLLHTVCIIVCNHDMLSIYQLYQVISYIKNIKSYYIVLFDAIQYLYLFLFRYLNLSLYYYKYNSNTKYDYDCHYDYDNDMTMTMTIYHEYNDL